MVKHIDRPVYKAATAVAVSTGWTVMGVWGPSIYPRHFQTPREIHLVSVSDIRVISLCVTFCEGMHSHISCCSQSFSSQKFSVPSLFFSISCPWRELRVQIESSTSSAAYILQIGLAGRVPKEVPVICLVAAWLPQSVLQPCPQAIHWLAR